MSTAEHMSDVEAHAAITDTILNYAEYVDGGEIELWAGLFCQDAIFDEGTVVTGRPAIQALLPKLLRLFTATSHHISNIRIKRTAPHLAHGTSYVYAWHRKLAGTVFEFWGRYVDAFAIEDGVWRFASRKVEQFGATGLEIDIDRVPRRDPNSS